MSQQHPSQANPTKMEEEAPVNNTGIKEEIFNSDDDHHPVKTKEEAEDLDDVLKRFHSEVKKGNAEKVREILEASPNKGADFINKIDIEDRRTALFYASIIPNEEISLETMKVLVDYGANINYKDGLKQTIAYYMARFGKVKSLEFLIAHGGSFDDNDNFGQSPLYYASREGQLEAVKILVEKGANVNKLDTMSQTALFYAAREGRLEVCRFLIDKGANVNQIDNTRYTPLYWAKKSGHNEVVKLLLERGAINTANGRVTERDLQRLNRQNKVPQVETSQPQTPTSNAPSATKNKVPAQTSQSMLKKRKKEKDEPRIAYKLVFTDEHGVSKELTPTDFEKFKTEYPDIASLILNPEKLVDSNTAVESLEKESWQKNAKKILNTLWKQRGAYIFHTPVDPVKFNIPDYFDIVRVPMDFGTIKSKLNANVYTNAKEFTTDMSQVFTNCILYNGTENEIGQIGVNIQKEYERLLQGNPL